MTDHLPRCLINTNIGSFINNNIMKCKLKIYDITGSFQAIILILTGFLVFSAPISQAKTLTDELGRKMRLPDDPKRVVSLAPSITEIIFCAGAGRPAERE